MKIYVLVNPEHERCCKLGITANLAGRLSTYLTGSPGRSFKYHKTWSLPKKQARRVERVILDHAKLAGLQLRGEWLRIWPEQLADWVEDEIEALRSPSEAADGPFRA